MFELEGSYSRAKYPTLNSYYNTFVAAGNLGWKFWQDRDYHSYIAVLGTAGYAMQKSDKDDAELFQKLWLYVWGIPTWSLGFWKEIPTYRRSRISCSAESGA